MLKYFLAATTLKAFSATPSTMKLYRDLGNKLGSKKRTTGKMPNYYFERAERMIRLTRQHGILKDGDRLLELGTGWLHWEAITCRLFYDIEAVLFDVWDNRQLTGLKNYIGQLDSMLGKLDITDAQRARAHSLIGEIKKVKDFRELYSRLGFQYLVDPTGGLSKVDKGSFDIVVSGGVLEHVSRKNSSVLVSEIAAALKPGGYSCHSIQIGDHLFAYDLSTSPKQYLRYSDQTWERWFENDVQYINRLQRSDWLEFFKKAGLVLLEEEAFGEDLAGLKVDKVFQHYDEADLRCSNLKLLHRKEK